MSVRVESASCLALPPPHLEEPAAARHTCQTPSDMATRAQWEQLASIRITNILRRRFLCTLRQLESKISEAGPLDQRPHPVSITDGIRALNKKHLITQHPLPNAAGVTAYALTDYDPTSNPDHKVRYDMLMKTYPVYKQEAGSDSSCADVLESAVHASFQQSTAFDVVHSEVQDGQPKTIPLDSSTINNSPPIDHVVRHSDTGILMLVEDKNIREWFYPDSKFDDIGTLIAKAIKNDLLPFLITRKVPYVSRLVFRHIGMLGFTTHHQYFHPKLQATMHDVKHTNGLGFHDILFTSQPIPHLVKYLDGLSAAVLAKYQEMFLSNKDVFYKLASEAASYYQFIEALGLSWAKIDEEAYDYGEYFS